jgi:DNA-binding CsgD family transcriptional regulator
MGRLPDARASKSNGAFPNARDDASARQRQCPQRAPLLLADKDWEAIVLRLTLSPREAQVARGLLDDLLESEVAARIGIAPRTAHAHVERLYKRLNVHSRHQLLLALFNTYLKICAERASTAATTA